MSSKEISADPDFLDGGLTEGHLAHSHDARTIAEFVRDQSTADSADEIDQSPNRNRQELQNVEEWALDRIEKLDPEQRRRLIAIAKEFRDSDADDARRLAEHAARLRLYAKIDEIAERESAFRRRFVSQSREESRGDSTFHTEHPAFMASVQRQNDEVKRAFRSYEADLKLFCGVHERTDGPDYRGVEHRQPVEVTRKRFRLSSAERKKRKELADLSDRIRRAIDAKDYAEAGAGLQKAKAIVGHGEFQKWVEREIAISTRTARRYMEWKVPRKSKRPRC